MAYRICLLALFTTLAVPAAAFDAVSGRDTPRLTFERNAGQAGSDVRYVVRGSTYRALILDDGFAVRLVQPTVPKGEGEPRLDATGPGAWQDLPVAATVRLKLVGQNRPASFSDGPVLAGSVNYLIAPKPDKWVRNVRRLSGVRQSGVYSGIDLVYRANGGHLQYDFVLAAGADPGQIRLLIEGADGMSLTADGKLRLVTPAGTLEHRAPVIYQDAPTGRRTVPGDFTLHGNELRFAIGDYDRSLAMVIDPTLQYATYLGGSDDELATGITVNAAGEAFVVGATRSVDFPVTGEPGPSLAGDNDVFIARYDAAGSLVYATYIGGTAEDVGNAIGLDAAGNVYVTGYTRSADFPIANAAQPTYAGGDAYPGSVFDAMDGFVLRLSADGSNLDYSTFVGGATSVTAINGSAKIGFEWLRDLHVTAAGIVTVIGETGTLDFPVTHSFGNRPCLDGDANAFSSLVSDIVLARYAADGTRQFAVCLGGSARDAGRGLTVDNSGLVHIAGFTRSPDLAVSAGAVQMTLHPGSGGFFYDGYIATLDISTFSVAAGSYLGGADLDYLQRIAITGSGNLVVVGSSYSADYPVTPGAYQSVLNGVTGSLGDAVVASLTPDLTTLNYATYLGGSGDDIGWALAVDATGRAIVAGNTSSRDFPLAAPIQMQIEDYFPASVAIGAPGAGFVATAAGDINGDGANDVIAADEGGVLTLFINNGTRAPFEGVASIAVGAAGDAVRDVHLADMNADALVDVVVANGSGANRLYLNNGSNDPFNAVAAMNITDDANSTWSIALADVNFDGRLDVLAGNIDAPSKLYVNNATAMPFAGVTAATIGPDGLVTRGIAVGDINADGLPDVVLGNDGGNLWVQYAAPGAPYVGAAEWPVGTDGDDTWSVAVADINFDGRPDVITGNGGPVAQPDRAYLNNLTASGFAAASGVAWDVAVRGTYRVIARDVTGDGLADIVAAHDTINRLSVATGAFTYAAEDIGIESKSTRGLAIADVDRDTDADIVTANESGQPLDWHANTGDQDLFVAMLSIDGSGLEFSTALGGTSTDLMTWGMTLDGNDNLWLAGYSASYDALSLNGAQTDNAGLMDAWLTRIAMVPDTDGDGIADASDNCTLTANPDQRDSNNDGYGNVCDADINNDNLVNFSDLGLMKASFFMMAGDPGYNADADLDGDDSVSFLDLGAMKALFFGMPGPSGLVR